MCVGTCMCVRVCVCLRVLHGSPPVVKCQRILRALARVHRMPLHLCIVRVHELCCVVLRVRVRK